MSKRGADNYITDQNWDQEVDEEEAGVFRQADDSVLKTRQVKKAKRRCAEEGESEGGTGGVFKGFAGFGKTSGTAPVAAFGGLGAKPLGMTTSANGSFASNKTNTESGRTSLFTTTKTSETIDTGNNKLTVKNGDELSKSPSTSRSKYLSQLKALNEGVTKWIKDHVDKNAYCILTPIFKDYEKYLADIDKKYPSHDKDDDEKETSTDSAKTDETERSEKSETSKSSLTTASTESSPAEHTAATGSKTSPPLFKFGGSPATATSTSVVTPPSSLSTGLFSASTSTMSTTSGTASKFSGFKFNTSTPLQFGAGASTSGFSFASNVKASEQKTESAEAGPAAEDDEYVPPKAEVSEISEDDAIYTKRCKLFFKKDEAWKEKGVGNLHLKPCGEKTQLLVRADTNLGNILLNIMLSSSLPVSRQGKNNVAIVCIPNPPIEKEEKQMTPMLIRVKTAEDADALFEKINELKR